MIKRVYKWKRIINWVLWIVLGFIIPLLISLALLKYKLVDEFVRGMLTVLTPWLGYIIYSFIELQDYYYECVED